MFSAVEIDRAAEQLFEVPQTEINMRDWMVRLMRAGVDRPLSAIVDRENAGGGTAPAALDYDLPLGYCAYAHTALSGLFLGSQEDALALTTPTVTARIGYTTDGYATTTWLTAATTLTADAVALAITTAAIPAGAIVFARFNIAPSAQVVGHLDLQMT